MASKEQEFYDKQHREMLRDADDNAESEYYEGGAKQERDVAMRMLENSYDMYVTSMNETIERRRNKKDADGNRVYSEESLTGTIELMETMLEDIVEQYKQLGGNPEDLKKRPVLKRNDEMIMDAVERVSAEDGMVEYRKKAVQEAKKRQRNKYVSVEEKEPETAQEPEQKPNRRTRKPSVVVEEKPSVVKAEPRVGNYTPEILKPIEKPAEPEKIEMPDTSYAQRSTFDEVSLPSKGECYKTKRDKIRVSHLVAYDENLILSPGLYRNGTFLDHILRNKILDNVDPDDLIQGDRDAIIIWLRAGGYGPMYPIRMTDEKTGEEFETNVNLSELKFKPFDLKGDENGYFDFKLPISGDLVKFRFLTAGDAKKLDKMRRDENAAENATDMREKLRDFIDFIEKSDKFTQKESSQMLDDLRDIEDAVYARYKDVEETYFTHDLTNRLILSTVSVNGISDREYVMNYVLNMNLKDAAEYRKYIIDNEPGIDYNIKVQGPGGDYIDTFLQLDQFIFVY